MAAALLDTAQLDREVTEYSKLEEASGLEAIRGALQVLGRRQELLMRVLAKYRSDPASDKALAEGERLLDRVIEQIARLIDMASAMAQKTPGAFSKAVASHAAASPAPPSITTIPASSSGGGSASSSSTTPTPKSSSHKHKSKASSTEKGEHKHKSSRSASSKKEAKTDAAAAPTLYPPAAVQQQQPPPRVIPVTAAAPAPAPIPVPPAAAAAAAAASMQPSESTRALLAGPPEIPPEEIEFDPDKDLLGGGAFGKVYRAKCRGKLVAVKIPNKQDLTESQLKLFRHEVTIMRKIFHPNVVLFLGACTKPGQLMIVTELMKHDLEHIIHGASRPQLTLHQKLRMAHDAALGINWLHGICQIIHRDLKPANLMLDEQLRVKVIDFGFSEILKGGRARDMRGPKGTALYMAPEVMKLEEFDHRSDVYSFGLILYELCTDQEPFNEFTDLDPFVQAVCYGHQRPVVPAELNLPPSLISLMDRCWHKDVARRPGFQQITEDLEEIMVDASIEDTPARPFWKKHFLKPQLQEQVSWADFEALLSREHNIAPFELARLEDFFTGTTAPSAAAAGGPRTITMERFNTLYTWFGNFFEPGPNAGGTRLLREIMTLVNSQWFHDDLQKDASESRLRQRAELTFLVRASHTDASKTPFTISKVRGGIAVHKRITRVSYDPAAPTRFGIMGETAQYASLPDLIQKLQTTGNVGTPCEKGVLANPYL
jgi:serine/threonine protein kinase